MRPTFLLFFFLDAWPLFDPVFDFGAKQWRAKLGYLPSFRGQTLSPFRKRKKKSKISPSYTVRKAPARVTRQLLSSQILHSKFYNCLKTSNPNRFGARTVVRDTTTPRYGKLGPNTKFHLNALAVKVGLFVAWWTSPACRAVAPLPRGVARQKIFLGLGHCKPSSHFDLRIRWTAALAVCWCSFLFFFPGHKSTVAVTVAAHALIRPEVSLWLYEAETRTTKNTLVRSRNGHTLKDSSFIFFLRKLRCASTEFAARTHVYQTRIARFVWCGSASSNNLRHQAVVLR